jgi:hypothetical protein
MGWLQKAKRAAWVAWDTSLKVARVLWGISQALAWAAWVTSRAAWRKYRQVAAGRRGAALANKAKRRAQRDAEHARLPRVEVVTYKTPKDYQRDAQRRMTDGWTIQAQSQETGQTHRIRRASNGALLGSFFMLPLTGAAIGGLSNKRTPGAITVTWVKGPVSSPNRPGAEPLARDMETTASPIASQLASLAELHKAGVLTDEEFSAKKAELLARM